MSTFTPVPHHLYSDPAAQARALREQIETAILERLNKLLAENAIDIMRLRLIAQYTLDHIPVNSGTQELYKSLGSFVTQFAELAPVVAKILQEHEQRSQSSALDEIKKKISQNDFEAIASVAQSAINYQQA